MTTERIEHILEIHNVPHYTQNGRVYADNMESFTGLFEYVTDVTEYTLSELKIWLGYWEENTNETMHTSKQPQNKRAALYNEAHRKNGRYGLDQYQRDN